jgi:hypothetical protein
MSESKWINGFPGLIVVCDPNGIIVEMNDVAAKSFASDGGRALVGNDMCGIFAGNTGRDSALCKKLAWIVTPASVS